MSDYRVIFFLDTLLDTRLSVLSSLDEGFAKSIITDDAIGAKYRNRPNDDFALCGYQGDNFKEAYDNRDVRALMSARPTKLLFNLPDIAGSILVTKSQQPHLIDGIEFVINMYPYNDLSEEERERILDAIGARLQVSINLVHDYIEPRELNAAYFKARSIGSVYFYDYRDWLKIHYNKSHTEETVGYSPGTQINTNLIFDDLDSLKTAIEFQNPNGETIDPNIGLRVMFAPYFRLQSVSSEMYSLATPQIVTARDFNIKK